MNNAEVTAATCVVIAVNLVIQSLVLVEAPIGVVLTLSVELVLGILGNGEPSDPVATFLDLNGIVVARLYVDRFDADALRHQNRRLGPIVLPINALDFVALVDGLDRKDVLLRLRVPLL